MKKVLFLITKSNWGGAQRYVFDLATNLPEEFDPVVALGGNGPLVEKLTAAGIRVITIPGLQRDISLKKELSSSREIRKIIKAERPDILHVNSSKAGLIGAVLGRISRVPRIIFTAHGWAFNEDRGGVARFFFGLLHWLTILAAHQTIAVSDALKQQMHWPFTKRRMTVVALGRPAITFYDKDEARGILEMHTSADEHGLTEFHDDQWVGTIAELHPVKRHDITIEAIAIAVHALPRLRYVIIGEGELRATLEAQVRELNLTDHVFFTGHLDEAARYLKAFDAFVLASRSEALGYVLLEAGLAHVPVIATKVGGIPELVTDGISGRLVPTGNAEALAHALIATFEEPEHTREFADTLLGVAGERTIERMVAETAACYDTH